MAKQKSWLIVLIAVLLLSDLAVVIRAGVSEPDQQALRSQYVGKVLIFRKSFRMAKRLDIAEDGTVTGGTAPGYWSVDGALQVKSLRFDKSVVTLEGAKLWANIQSDGRLHFFPASGVLKGKGGYPETEEVAFHTGRQALPADGVRDRLKKVFLDEHESVLISTPQPIAAYIQKIASEADVDPITGKGFEGTLPKAISRPDPAPSREAQLVGQAGREKFVVYVDAQGGAAVTGFTNLLQYGLEETTIEAVKGWKFQPAMKDGKAVGIRIPMYIDFKKVEVKPESKF
jgi:hypothetical protein